MRVYNTMSRTKEDFVTQTPGIVKMYACGITVYDECHMGHAKQAIVYDMISSYLRYKGYDVTYVRNYTDVDDKIINRANELNINALDYSEDRIKEAERIMTLLRVKPADISPKASDNIDNIIKFIEGLMAKGAAYSTPRGDVYFSVKKCKDYGKLSRKNIDDLINGVRKEVEEGKNDPLDFALWKSAKEGEISWDSPWGKGRPGWHIECSVMIKENLGDSIDIHGGGKDLVFPHHENEIAQSETLTGKPFAKYWIHSGLITIDGQKMSKSIGNTKTIKEMLSIYNPEVIRYNFLSKHYASDTDLSETALALAEKQMFYFYTALNEIDKLADNTNITPNTGDEFYSLIEKNFTDAMDDDFNTAIVTANLFEIVKYMNNLIKDKKCDQTKKIGILIAIKQKVCELYSVIGLLKENPNDFINNMVNKHIDLLNIDRENISILIQERIVAKQEKNYKRADEIRQKLENTGIALFDSKDNTTWGIKELYNL